MVLGIDPGPSESAYCLCDGYNVLEADKVDIDALLSLLTLSPHKLSVAVESIQCYGQVVGKETFETCYKIGRIQQVCKQLNMPLTLYPRPEYMRSILGAKAPRGKADSMLWQALKLRFGGDKKGEPLHLLKGNTDKRSAYAVAVYHMDLTGRSK